MEEGAEEWARLVGVQGRYISSGAEGELTGRLFRIPAPAPRADRQPLSPRQSGSRDSTTDPWAGPPALGAAGAAAAAWRWRWRWLVSEKRNESPVSRQSYLVAYVCFGRACGGASQQCIGRMGRIVSRSAPRAGAASSAAPGLGLVWWSRMRLRLHRCCCSCCCCRCCCGMDGPEALDP